VIEDFVTGTQVGCTSKVWNLLDLGTRFAETYLSDRLKLNYDYYCIAYDLILYCILGTH